VFAFRVFFLVLALRGPFFVLAFRVCFLLARARVDAAGSAAVLYNVVDFVAPSLAGCGRGGLVYVAWLCDAVVLRLLLPELVQIRDNRH
jgi:hypothetical protein